MVLGLVFVVVPLVEIFLIVKVAGLVGVVPALLLLIFCSAGGAWLCKREGTAAFRRVRASLSEGRMPTTEVIDAFVIMAAGALLLVPGFLTDLVGVVLLLPPTRSVVRRLVADGFRWGVARRVRLAGVRLGGDGAGTAAAAAAAAARRAYRRPSEPSEPSARPSSPRPGPSGPSGTQRRPGDPDIIDVDGEEIDLFGTRGELGPPT